MPQNIIILLLSSLLITAHELLTLIKVPNDTVTEANLANLMTIENLEPT